MTTTKQQNPDDVVVPAMTAGEWRERLSHYNSLLSGSDEWTDAPIDSFEWVYSPTFHGYGFEFKIGHNLASNETHTTWAPRLPTDIDFVMPRGDGAPTLAELVNDLRCALLWGIHRDEQASLREPDKSTVDYIPVCEPRRRR
jgi:hypothetical protein